MTALPAENIFANLELEEGPFRAGLTAFLEATRQLPGASAEELLVISGGVVEPSVTGLVVDTELSAPADDLTNISTANLPAGRIISLRATDPGRVVSVMHGAGGDGQIFLIGSDDVDLMDPDEILFLQRRGGDWREINRSQALLSLALGGLVDVDFTTNPPQEGDSLKYSGGKWVPGGGSLTVPEEFAETSKVATANDNLKILVSTALDPVAVTLPEAANIAIPTGTQIIFVQGDAGQITFTGEGAEVLLSLGGLTSTLAQGATVAALRLDNGWRLIGALG